VAEKAGDSGEGEVAGKRLNAFEEQDRVREYADKASLKLYTLSKLSSVKPSEENWTSFCCSDLLMRSSCADVQTGDPGMGDRV